MSELCSFQKVMCSQIQNVFVSDLNCSDLLHKIRNLVGETESVKIEVKERETKFIAPEMQAGRSALGIVCGNLKERGAPGHDRKILRMTRHHSSRMDKHT